MHIGELDLGLFFGAIYINGVITSIPGPKIFYKLVCTKPMAHNQLGFSLQPSGALIYIFPSVVAAEHEDVDKVRGRVFKRGS